MGDLVELKISSEDNASVFIESTEVEESQIQQAGGYTEKEFDKLLERVKPFCETIMNNFRTLSIKPDSATAEFGLSLSAEGNILFVKAGGEASIKITLTWNNLK